MMRQRIPILVLAMAALVAPLLASCGEDDEGYPPFEMTYTVSHGGEAESTWELDYRSADEWTKTLVAADELAMFEVGRTAHWNGRRIAWATDPDGRFVEDQSISPPPSHAWPEQWLSYELSALPNSLFEEVEPVDEGTRRFRNEFNVGGDPPAVWVEVVTFDVETGIPVRYEMSAPDAIRQSVEVVSLELR